MKLALKIAGVVVLVLGVVGAGGYAWASMAADRMLSRTFEVHEVDFPIPFPLDDQELAALEAGDGDARREVDEEERDRLAREGAVERGRHLVEARYACADCHGADFGGGVMVDAAPIGTLRGPNLTRGAGSAVLDYTPADWDRAVRHGILPDGRPASMPSVDFHRMSDRELSDIVAYIASLPPVDHEVPPPVLGPLGKFLLATGEIPLTADLLSHDVAHPTLPPAEEPSREFGEHLAATCTGCHGESFAGGPIPGGDPSWPPARNLTPHPDALGPWSYEDFVAAMREATRPDGREIREPMSHVSAFAQQMTYVELEAMWLYLRSVPEVAPGE